MKVYFADRKIIVGLHGNEVHENRGEEGERGFLQDRRIKDI